MLNSLQMGRIQLFQPSRMTGLMVLMIRAMSVKEDKDMCAMFLHCMGGSTRKVLKKLDNNGIEKKVYKIPNELNLTAASKTR